ncbi:unnamed protein product [Phyllotreta striolata]|uniref:General transcription factor 3C polypeptide 5 n=1 Tax=Phyllotreta striolata TaxID=444603 RepID=A0A9N9TXD5_PHYSR|nr:unnamed protein product [Phyllotreta striolata]
MNSKKAADKNTVEDEPMSNISSTIVDENRIYKLDRKFVRILYPGVVKNVPKALETLGGIYNVETAVSDPKKKLELRFHPENKFNKPCYSDMDTNPGLLVEVTKKNGEIDYKIIGYTNSNFTFNKALDYQYLPLVENKETDQVEYVHDKIFPKKLPTLEFLMSKESKHQPPFLLPASFSRYELSHHTLYLSAEEKFNLDKNDRPELFKMFKKKTPKHPYIQPSYTLNINDTGLKIPDSPKPLALKLVKDKLCDEAYLQMQKLFDERPMWLKAAVQYKLGLKSEVVKTVLPAVAYFWTNGPWRIVWTKFGVDPRQDFNMRIYQTLDFRIREGTKIKIKAKLKASSSGIDESHFMLKPDMMPPFRQMFYQFCDLQIPEVQDMLQRLPKTPGHLPYNPKTGWLPLNFSEHCREIANRYILERVRHELLEDNIRSQSKYYSSPDEDPSDSTNTASVSSGMLDNLKRGFRRNLNLNVDEDIDETIVLSEDETDDVEKLIEEDISYANEFSDDSEMELDLEAVEEINEIISQVKN